MPNHRLSIAVAAVMVLTAGPAAAQLAPTGAHYAGRATDTGFTAVSGTGGYSASVPLDLPPARGGIPLPLSIVYTTRGVGAAGAGWDVPLSFVRRDTSVAHRRPAFSAGTAPRGREKMIVSLGGRTLDMVPQGGGWVARRDAPDLELAAEPGGYKVTDGAGLTYHFTAPFPGTIDDLWILTSIVAPGDANRVDLAYERASTQTTAGTGFSIDLKSLRYNSHATSGCPKDEVRLAYNPPTMAPISSAPELYPVPISLAMIGDHPFVRLRTLASVTVSRRATCADSFDAALRTYNLTYEPDVDTGQPRLRRVTMTGRAGTPEAATALPIANYTYGSASNRTGGLRYDRGLDIPLPADVPGAHPPLSATAYDPAASSPDGGKTYVTTQDLMDVTGDGRADLVYPHNGGLQVAVNRPVAGGSSLTDLAGFLGPPVGTGVLASHSTSALRYFYAGQNRDHVWRQTIDVNGDGRLDVIDATVAPDTWTIYVNTPSWIAPVGWVKRSFSIRGLRAILDRHGHNVDGDYLPLARRTTGFDILSHNECWQWINFACSWVPAQGPEGCSGVPSKEPEHGERTFTEWELRDLNGDGYPDLVFNTTPVRNAEARPPSLTNSDGTCPSTHYQTWAENRHPFGPASDNDVAAVLNVVGVRFDTDSEPFSAPITIAEGDTCGVAQWHQETCSDCRVPGQPDLVPDAQFQICAIDDVNGDGLADRIDGTQVRIGDGRTLDGALGFYLPDRPHHFNPHDPMCSSSNPPLQFNPEQHTALRDLNGDGIPDFVHGSAARLGTGAGFSPTWTLLTVPSPKGFAISDSEEDCAGHYAETVGGLYDVDGDGRPEVVHVLHNPSHLEVYQLGGAGAATGRLTSIDNGYGAVTTIGYRSAKEDPLTGHQVPFPEIVVASVETAATRGLGGALAAVRYAYGDAVQIFDPALDAFTMPAYGRSIEVRGTGRSSTEADVAIIRDTYDLPPLVATDSAARFDRYQQVGKLRDETVLSNGVPRDPWTLLGTNLASDARRIGGSYHTWASQYVAPTLPLADPIDCLDIADPYNWQGTLALPWDPMPCGHGFGHARATETWEGSAAPPSTANLQTRAEVLTVDGYGRVLSVRDEHDRARPDDDVCVETTFAQPQAVPRVLTAMATRTVTDCGPPQRVRALGYDAWEYDGQAPGYVTLGRATAHDVKSYATDNGDLIRAYRDFTATYDPVGNPSTISSTRDVDGATRTLTIGYDGFGLEPVQLGLAATGVATQTTVTTRDPVTLELRSTRDPNGTIWGHDFDGFGREVRTTVTAPSKPLTVTGTATYTGFGAATGGRSITAETFADATSPARSVTVELDELGRVRRALRKLGADYGNESLVTSARTYDGLGRVTFEADPYPTAQAAATAYGTTNIYRVDGTLQCTIRGSGVQAPTTVTNLAAEILPTCVDRVYTNRALELSVRAPDALQSGTQQNGVARTERLDASGLVLQRATWKNGARLEAENLGYDRLGQLVSLTRFRDPVNLAEAVMTSFRLDSRGHMLQLSEPETATRFFTYSDWGELRETAWVDPTTTPAATTLRLTRTYDALGRTVTSRQTVDNVLVPSTDYTYVYDAGTPSSLLTPANLIGRLARTQSSIGRVDYSYDGLGNLEARLFTDPQNVAYLERTVSRLDGSLEQLELKLPDNAYRSEKFLYDHDTAQRLQSVVSDDGTRVDPLFAASTVDAWGRLRNGSFGQDLIFEGRHADVGRRLPIEDVISSSAGGRRRFEHLGFDAVGRETRRAETRDSATPVQVVSSYDALGRLIGSWQTQGAATQSLTAYNYDPLGNASRLLDSALSQDAQLTFSTTDRDRPCRIAYVAPFTGACNVSHDGAGNVVREPARTGTRVLTYYPSGAPRSITLGNVGASFRYDGSGAIRELDVTGSAATARSERRYGLVERRVVAGVPILIRHIPGLGRELVSRRGPAGPWIYPFADGRGTRVTGDQNGAFVQDVSYFPFGDARSTGAVFGSLSYTNDQWNGGDALAGLGVVQVGARLYDPAIGRFLSRDPLIVPRDATRSNPYAFAHNDPVNRSDPSGLDPNLWIWSSNSGLSPASSGGGDNSALLGLIELGAMALTNWGGNGGAEGVDINPMPKSPGAMFVESTANSWRTTLTYGHGYDVGGFDLELAVRTGRSFESVIEALEARTERPGRSAGQVLWGMASTVADVVEWGIERQMEGHPVVVFFQTLDAGNEAPEWPTPPGDPKIPEIPDRGWRGPGRSNTRTGDGPPAVRQLGDGPRNHVVAPYTTPPWRDAERRFPHIRDMPAEALEAVQCTAGRCTGNRRWGVPNPGLYRGRDRAGNAHGGGLLCHDCFPGNSGGRAPNQLPMHMGGDLDDWWLP